MLHKLHTEWTKQSAELTRSIFKQLIGRFITISDFSNTTIYYIYGIDDDNLNTISIKANTLMQLIDFDIDYDNITEYKIIDDERVIKLFTPRALNLFQRLIDLADNRVIGGEVWKKREL